MKINKLLLSALVALACCASSPLFSQSPFTKESHVLHFGLGLGGYEFYVYNSLPIFNVSYDQGLIDDLGIGNLGIGGAVGVKPYWYDDGVTRYSFSRVYLLARGTYHFHFVNSDKFDFYAGATAGVAFITGDKNYGNYTYGTNYYPGAFAGINYLFSPAFGVFAEAGYGIGFLNGGLALNF